MTPQQIQHVQRTFAQLVPNADHVASTFYAELFDLDPSLRRLFRGDIQRQGEMLVSMLATAVRGLTSPEALMPVLQGLGRRHAGYGVVDQHYVTVGLALIGTLQKSLGTMFSPDVRTAWVAAYTMMAAAMKQGARDAQAIPEMAA